MGDLNALLERVRAASGPDRNLDLAIHMALEPANYAPGWAWDDLGRPPHLTASLDATVALVERVLPGWQFALAGPWKWAEHTPRAGQPIWYAEVARDSEDDGLGYKEMNDLSYRGATPALALISALLSALLAGDHISTKATVEERQ